MIRIIIYNCYHSVYSFQTKQYSNICVLHWIVAHSKLIVYFLNLFFHSEMNDKIASIVYNKH